ncbi:MAG: hypothetical protein IIW53_04665 [Rikenellaceae bacterium]|nr:hypothetical protein [Rikenellaceae bacterium]MBQ5371427.1 hypothetical protein [Rikenellaceae bacterium]MBQ5853368.1 hypothetical protein [Rikenellaceae bacterium]
MTNALTTRNTASVALYEPKRGTTAVEVRRQLAQVPEVMAALTTVEQFIFTASTRTTIAEMPTDKLVERARTLFRQVAMDVGYNIPSNAADWQYIQTRLLDILRRYYGTLTLADIKLAFELASTGELDAHLPRDGQGNPDKKHYQQFNAEYFAKILNAYKRKREEVSAKAQKALPPAPARPIDPERARAEFNERELRNYALFLQYKYRGRVAFEGFDNILLLDWVQRLGYADQLPEKFGIGIRSLAYRKYMATMAKKTENIYKTAIIKREGRDSRELDGIVYDIARARMIRKAFDAMIRDEVQFNEIIKLR